VIVPKSRYKIFTKEVQEVVRDEIKKLCVWMQIEIIEGHVCEDHIHICISIPPKIAISEIVGTLKNKTAIRMFNKFSELRKGYWRSHFWSRGYYVTIGRNEKMIREYIKNQDKLDRLGNQWKLF
jgi:putative transposase